MSIKLTARSCFLFAVAAAALGILSAAPGHAAVVTMTFSGTYLSGSSVDGIVPSTGLPASGTLSFDSTALSLKVDGLNGVPYFNDSQIYAGPVSFTATVGSHSYTSTSVVNFYLSNANYSLTSQYFEAQAVSQNGVYMGLDSSSGTQLFRNSNDPGSFFSHAIAGEFFLSPNIGSDPELVFNVTMNVSAVPEPSTWAMMILGFIGIGLIAYRKRDVLRFA